jgi:histidyl-tRNA synthetase
LYPDAAKLDKQFKHIERREIPFTVKEISSDGVSLRNNSTGIQTTVTIEELSTLLK